MSVSICVSLFHNTLHEILYLDMYTTITRCDEYSVNDTVFHTKFSYTLSLSLKLVQLHILRHQLQITDMISNPARKQIVLIVKRNYLRSVYSLSCMTLNGLHAMSTQSLCDCLLNKRSLDTVISLVKVITCTSVHNKSTES